MVDQHTTYLYLSIYLSICYGTYLMDNNELFLLLWLLYIHDHDQLHKHICMRNHNNDTTTTTQFFKKYTSHFIWKGCVWEGVGNQTELQHIDPHSIGHNRISFLFSWAAQPGAQSLWVLAFSTASCLQLVWSPN